MNIEALAQLGGFTGTENWYKHPLFPILLYTDGVKHLAENADCYWLLDLIGGYQQVATKDPMLRQMQFWRVEPATAPVPAMRNKILKHEKAAGTAVARVVCERDSGNTAIIHELDITDFPFQAFHGDPAKVWVAPTGDENGRIKMVALLPSEY